MKSIFTQWKIWLICILLMPIYACFDASQFDTNKLATTTNLTAGFYLPIAKANLKLSDFFSEMKDTLEFDKANDSLIRLKYNDPNIYSFSVADVYKVPAFSNITKTIGIGTYTFPDFTSNKDVTVQSLMDQSADIKAIGAIYFDKTPAQICPTFGPLDAGSFEYTLDKDFEYLKFSAGTLYLTLSNSLPCGIAVSMMMVNKLDNSVVGTKSFSVAANSTSTAQILPLAGVTLSKVIVCKLTAFSTLSPVAIKSTDKFNVKVDIKQAAIGSGKATFPVMSETADYSMITGTEKLESIKLISGKINLSITSGLSSDCQVVLTLPNSTINGQAVTKTITVIKKAVTTTILDLANSITLPTNGTLLPVKYEVASLTPTGFVFNSTDNVSVTANATGFDFEYVKGFFGQKSYSITPDMINLNMDAFDKIDGGLIFTSPVLKLKITSNVGIPVNMNMNVIGKSSTGKTETVLVNQTMKYPTVMGNTAADSIMPNVVNFLALPPKTINYSGSVVINPTNNPAISNFVTKTGKVQLGISFDVPFIVKTDQMTIRDTTDISLSANDVKQATSMEVEMNYVNKIPFDVGVSLILYNSKTKQVIQTIVPKDAYNMLLSAAETVNGKVTLAKSGKTVLTLTKDQILKFPLADKMIVVGLISTKGKTVELHANYTLGINLLLKTALDIKL